MSNVPMQNARSIGLCMFQYAVDNDGKYPEGNSSTEVFQKLIDGKYIDDPSFFYLPLPGKIKASLGQRLKPENVCWDITCCLDSITPEQIPVVFMTGYKIDYVSGSATLLVKPYPKSEEPLWREWLRGGPERTITRSPGIPVCYKSNSAKYIKLDTSPNAKGIIPHFIDPSFSPNANIYRQLTPEGPLFP